MICGIGCGITMTVMVAAAIATATTAAAALARRCTVFTVCRVGSLNRIFCNYEIAHASAFAAAREMLRKKQLKT